jgi:hypothetical protein
MNKFLLFFALLIILIFGFLYFVFVSSPKEVSDTNNTVVVVDGGPKHLQSTTLVCNAGKTIEASFFEENLVAGEAPGATLIPQKTAKIILDDGRTLELKQAVSADGGRYVSEGDVFVFWTKGNGALILENGAEKTYRGCVRVAVVDAGVKLPSVYADKEGTFSLRLPGILSSTTLGYAVDELFTRVLTPTQRVDGVRFTIPAAMASGTNLSRDSYLSVEHIPNISVCTASLFFSGAHSTSSVTDAGVVYSRATSSEGGAGNRYEEMVYALTGTSPCIAVRYFIHYTALTNYATGTVTEYNKQSLLTSFDQIRRTLVVNQ